MPVICGINPNITKARMTIHNTLARIRLPSRMQKIPRFSTPLHVGNFPTPAPYWNSASLEVNNKVNKLDNATRERQNPINGDQTFGGCVIILLNNYAIHY